MIRFVIFILTVLIFHSCKVVKNNEVPIIGEYSKIGPDFQYTLILKEDHIFLLTKSYKLYGKSSCDGKWHVDSKASILILDCNDIQDPVDLLSSQYMTTRHYIVNVKNKTSIDFEGSILIKK